MGAGLSLTISDDSSGGGCTSVGTWDSTTKTCTLTIDLNEAIAIYGPGVTLNGNGHTVSGGGGFAGIIIYGSSITVKNLKMTGFSYTIRVDGAGNNRIINNTILNSAFGLYVRSTDNLIANNTIDTASMQGIALVYGNNVVTNNYIMNSIWGVDIWTHVGSSNNKIYNNNFIDNTLDIVYDPFVGSDTFNLAKPIGGNYYNDYDTPEEGCNDLDLDGFCDKLYTPSIGIQDNLPWTQMNGWLDSIPPTTTIALSGTLGNNDWYISDVLVTLTAADNEGGSGVKNTEYSLDNVVWIVYAGPFTLDTDGEKTVYYRSTDNRDNVETAKSQGLKIDETNPIITGAPTTSPNVNGWYNSDVTVKFTCEDSTSGPDESFFDVFVTLEGLDQSAEGTCTDNAGNTADAVVENINIDKTKPTITITTPIATNYLLNQNVLADWTASDASSGIDTAIGTTPSGNSIDTGTVGSKTFTVTATDNAGNSYTQTVAYSVGYIYGGILQPIEADGSSIFKFGSTVPVKFQLKDYNGNYVSSAVAKLTLKKVSDSILGDEIEAISTSAATTGNLFRYDSTSNQYIFNLGTKSLSKGTWKLTISLDDGTLYSVQISLK
jgi:parallel beta-helix repeat protein